MMMQTLHVNKLKARYHLAEHQLGQRQKLNWLLQQCMDYALETAMTEAGIRDTEELLIREIYVPIYLEMQQSDAVLIAAWSKAFAQTIKRALQNEHDSSIIRFPSRLHAMQSFVRDRLQQKAERDWAWKKMGFLKEAWTGWERDAQSICTSALAQEPVYITPVIKQLFYEGTLSKTFTPVNLPVWAGLVDLLLESCGQKQLITELQLPWHTFIETRQSENEPQIQDLNGINSLSEVDNRIFQLILHHYYELVQQEPIYLRILLLVLWLNEANVVRRPKADILKRLQQLHFSLSTALPNSPHLQSSRKFPSQQQNEDVSLKYSDFHNSGQLADSLKNQNKQQWDPEPQLNEQENIGKHKPKINVVDPEIHFNGVSNEQIMITAYGGLLYLVNLFVEIDLYSAMAQSSLLQGRETAWILKQLAQSLTDITIDDPALAVFCGLNPVDHSWPSKEIAATELELAQIKRWRREIIDALHERVSYQQVTEDELMTRVCVKRASLLVQPGWVDVVFSNEDVDIQIRRIGLDLDPGFVAPLGAVIRFIYE